MARKRGGFKLTKTRQYIGLGLLALIAVLLVIYVMRPSPEPVASSSAEVASSWPTQSSEPARLLELPKSPTVLLLGDSFAQGNGASPATNGYAYLLNDAMGWGEEVVIDFAPRTGFVSDNKGNSLTYGERISARIDSGELAPDLVIFQGSVNDTSATTDEMAVAAGTVLEKINTGWPSAQVVVTYPISYRDFSHLERGLKRAISDTDTFLFKDSFPKQWLPQRKALYAEDGWHPSTEGHAVIAERMAESIRSAMGKG